VTAVAIRQHSEAWHDWRAQHVTATDFAIIAGEKGSALQLWAEKRRLVEPEEFDQATRDLMDEGLAIQPYLLDFYGRKTGRRVRNINVARQSRTWPVAGCSPDGEVVGEPVGLEAKMSVAARWRGLDDAVPGDVFAQCQWQMFVTGWVRVDVVGFIHGRPQIVEVHRDPGYLEDGEYLARQFWGWVLSGERPPLDGTENARRVLSALHPRNDGRLLAAPPEVVDLVRDIAAAKAEVKGTEASLGTMENALRALIGDADGFEGEWGKATWKRNADSSRTNWPAVAKAYRAAIDHEWDLIDSGDMVTTALPDRSELDAIESTHTETSEGPRVLRVVLKGDA
jgi:putative phage-type endonuclease